MRHSIVLLSAIMAMQLPAIEIPDASDIRPALEEIPRANVALIEAHAGYSAGIFAESLNHPGSVDFDDAGNTFVALDGAGEHGGSIVKFSANGLVQTVATGLATPVADILWNQGKLYISQRGMISVLDEKGLRDVIADLPSLGDFSNTQLAAGPDGWIYFGQGGATNSGVIGPDNMSAGWPRKHPDFHDFPAQKTALTDVQFESVQGSDTILTSAFQSYGKTASIAQAAERPTGAIYRMRPDGSNLEAVATGFRNPLGIALNPAGQLFAVEKSFEVRGSRPIAEAPDCIYQVKIGAWYGFPDFAGGLPVTDSLFTPPSGNAPHFLLREHPLPEKPRATLSKRRGVGRAAFSTNARFGFVGQLFLAESGTIPGVLSIEPDTGETHSFLHPRSGPAAQQNSREGGLRQPVAVRFSRTGDELFVVDAGTDGFPGTGVIWRVRPVQRGKPAEVEAEIIRAEVLPEN